MKVGLNLYSIRKLVQTEQDFLATCKKLKEMGYDFIQFSGAPFDEQMIKRVSDKSGLPVVLTHVSETAIVEETEKLMRQHEVFNCKNIGLGCINAPKIVEEEFSKNCIDKLNLAGKKMAEKGYKFFYHAHHFEFYKYENGTTLFEYILEKAPYINLTLDTYWLQYGGVSVIEYIKKLKGRIDCVHLKDYKIIYNENGYCPTFTSIGDGNMNFKDVIKACKKAGTKYFIVEQDNASEKENPLLEVERSIKYLKENF